MTGRIAKRKAHALVLMLCSCVLGLILLDAFVILPTPTFPFFEGTEQLYRESYSRGRTYTYTAGLLLHTSDGRHVKTWRNLSYGELAQGQLIQVDRSMIFGFPLSVAFGGAEGHKRLSENPIGRQPVMWIFIGLFVVFCSLAFVFIGQPKRRKQFLAGIIGAYMWFAITILVLFSEIAP